MSLEISRKFLRFFSVQEMNGGEGTFYSFKTFRLNIGERKLLRGEQAVALTPKAFDVLAYLVERSGHLVERDELLHGVWRDAFVEEANLSRSIHIIRRALGENDNGNKFIETVPTKGYRFVAAVTELTQPHDGIAEREPGKPATGKQSASVSVSDTASIRTAKVSRRIVVIAAVAALIALAAAYLLVVRSAPASGIRRKPTALEKAFV